LRDRREHILKTITQEEERFLRTLDQGLSQLDHLLSESPSDTSVLSGEDAFELYATYGLPFEITRDVVAERGCSVDENGFQKAMATHRDLSGGSILEVYGAELAFYADLFDDLKREGKLGTEGVIHKPHGATELVLPVIALVRGGERVEAVQADDEIELVLPATPFYVESGGQVSDTGMLFGGESWKIQVTGMRQPVPGLIIHVARVVEAAPQEGDTALAQVDIGRRMDIMRNHTATHLLHRGLREVLGRHVQQAGSLVTPERLRFDFTHQTKLSTDQLDEIARSVNAAILRNHRLSASQQSYKDALESGVIALFGEKYGETVRVVRIGDSDELISQELCGGTHVRETGEINQFHIVSEGSVGAGLRRIEAVTGRIAQEWVSEHLTTLHNTANFLDCPPKEVFEKVHSLTDALQRARKEAARLAGALAQYNFEHLMARAVDLDGAKVLGARVTANDVDALRQMTDWFRERHPSSAIVVGAVIDRRPLLVAAVTSDLVARGLRADDLVRELAHVIGGGGGGKPTLAQAGGRHADRLDEALAKVPKLAASKLD
jgi:alanyl-tRNA synthetase